MEYFLDSFNYKIFTKTEGTGKPVLLLHSLWGSHLLFDSLSLYLSSKFKVIRIDFPGHGRSSSPDNEFTFEEFSDVIDDILNQLGITEKVNLIGHSMGGFQALAFANKHKDKSASLILIHSLVREADHKSIKHRLRQADLIRQGRKKLLLQLANETNFAPGNAEKFPEEYKQLDLISGVVTKDGALTAINAINNRQNYLPFLSQAQIPTLIVIGKNDRIYNPEDQLSEYENIPGAKVLILQNSGHMGFYEEANIFLPEITSFLESLPG